MLTKLEYLNDIYHSKILQLQLNAYKTVVHKTQKMRFKNVFLFLYWTFLSCFYFYINHLFNKYTEQSIKEIFKTQNEWKYKQNLTALKYNNIYYYKYDEKTRELLIKEARNNIRIENYFDKFTEIDVVNNTKTLYQYIKEGKIKLDAYVKH